MSTITAILEPDADGTLHLPLPEELRRGKVRVVATLQAEQERDDPGNLPATGTPLEALKELRKLKLMGESAGMRPLLATAEMVEKRKAAFQKLRELGGLSHVIPDPVAWQREQRKDRPLPGRD